jgi:hypothetical protein
MAIGTCWETTSWDPNPWDESPAAWADAGEPGPAVGGGMRQMLMGLGCWLLILIQVSGTPLIDLDYSQLGVETRTQQYGKEDRNEEGS